MNRIVIIGNGFDIAHGLKTRYEDFLIWYIRQKLETHIYKQENTTEQDLCSIEIPTGINIYICSDSIKKMEKYKEIEDSFKEHNIKINKTLFFKNITNSVMIKGWVDVEYEYYKLLIEHTKNQQKGSIETLNQHLHILQEKLIEYLQTIDEKEKNFYFTNDDIYYEIYKPIRKEEVAIKAKNVLNSHIKNYSKNAEAIYFNKKEKYSKVKGFYSHTQDAESYIEIKKFLKQNNISNSKIESESEKIDLFWLPDQIMLLNFNYTSTALEYKEDNICDVNYIHGQLNKPQNPIIFGYGDELDKNFKILHENDNNKYLDNVKSIKYQESDNYRKMQDLIESDYFQIYIMGHSCGNSDRTLLNTLFEHENCISIKPYYYQKDDGTDNYTELIQNISRNFTDMKLMRDRVVNKTYCKPLPQNK